ncbi:MAG: amino acid permease [Cyanobacteriota bacterium]
MSKETNISNNNVQEETELKHVLKPIHIWAIAVGLVISGDYIGWNLGLANSGPMGLIIATLLITVMYITFIFSYTELTTSIPNSGGPFSYAKRAMGPYAGFMAGCATLIEFVFAPPAIALGIGAYLEFIATKFDILVPSINIPISNMIIDFANIFSVHLPDFYIIAAKVWLAIGCFGVFILINLIGIEAAATFELFVTIIAIVELLVFCAITGPHVKMENIVTQPILPSGIGGIFSSIPFAIWFYLAIEGVAMSAEETANPKKDIPVAYISGIITLVVLALGTAFCTMGVIPWQQLATIDKPLPVAIQAVLPDGHWLTKIIAVVGVFGLIASFHGIIIGYSRQAFALSRAKYLPHFLSKLSKKSKVPYMALIVPGIIGSIACLTDYTDAIITISVLGAIVLYILSLTSLFVLRKKEPDMERPFIAPFYPIFPIIALSISLISLASIIYYNFTLFLITLGIFFFASLYYYFFVKNIVNEN